MNWKRSLIGVGIAVPVIALLAYGLTTDPKGLVPRVGAQASPFELVTLDGSDTVRLAEYAGDIVVVNFFGSWCSGCYVEHPELTAAARYYEGRGVHFLGVLFKDTPAGGTRFLEEVGGQPYPAIWDSNLRASIAYGLRGAPETFVIDRDGRIAFHRQGIVSFGQLRSAIDPLLAAAAPLRDASGTP